MIGFLFERKFIKLLCFFVLLDLVHVAQEVPVTVALGQDLDLNLNLNLDHAVSKFNKMNSFVSDFENK